MNRLGSMSTRMIEKYVSWRYFERAVAFVLTLGSGVVVLMAVAFFVIGLAEPVMNFRDGWDYSTFQRLFDRLIAVLIALELSHSVQQMAAGEHGLTQVRTVLLIGVLAVVRKFILLEIESTSGLFLAGLAAAILALGAVYALILWVERRSDRPAPPAPGEAETPGAEDAR